VVIAALARRQKRTAQLLKVRFYSAAKWNAACCLNQAAPRTNPLQTPRKNLLATALLGIAWTVSVALGLRILFNYETTPGQIGAVPPAWPSASKIGRSNDRPTLVMLAHPRCPCTRASISELAKIMARAQGRMDAYVLFFKPRQSGAAWEDSALRGSAAAIPGVKVLSDVDGVEARRFGAETSGHTLLFDRDGGLLFSGGITQSRGHAGENAGERAIVSMVNNQPSARASTFVFGCSLGNRSQLGDKARCLK